jgi:hypothetical protein
VRAMNRSLKQGQSKSRAGVSGHSEATEVTQPHAARPKIDKSAPIFGEPKRIRYQKHLRFVASQPWNPFSRHHIR